MMEEEEGGGMKWTDCVYFKLTWRKFVQLEGSDFPYYNQQGNQVC